MITALTTTAVRGFVTGPNTGELLPTSLKKRSRPGEAVPAGLGWAGLPGLAGWLCVFLNFENWKVSLGKIVETPEKSKKIESWVLGSPPRKSYVITSKLSVITRKFTRKSVNSGFFSFLFSFPSCLPKPWGVGCGPKKHTSRTPRQTVSFGEGKRWGETPRQRIKGFGLFSGDTATPPRPVGKANFRGEGAPPAPATRGGTAPIAGNKKWNPTG